MLSVFESFFDTDDTVERQVSRSRCHRAPMHVDRRMFTGISVLAHLEEFIQGGRDAPIG